MAPLPSKLGERRRRRRIFWTSVFSVVALLICSGAVSFLYWSAVTISSVRVVGAEAERESDLSHAVEEGLIGKYIGIFPKHSIFLYPKRGIEEKLMAQFARLKKAELSFSNFHTLTLTVEERKLYALWCGSSAPHTLATSSSPADCSFLDAEGFIFPPDAAFTGAVYMRYFGEATTTLAGKSLLSPAEFQSLDAFMHTLPSLSLAPLGVELRPDGDVTVFVEGGTELLLSRQKEYAKTLDDIRSALSADVLKNKKLTDVEYLDFRFGDRAFFKFK